MRMCNSLFLALSLLGIVMCQTAQAEDQSESQKIIQQCYDKNQHYFDSGVTSEMVKGAIQSEQCLREKINKLADIYLNDVQAKQAFQQKFDTFMTAITDVNNILYGACPQLECGTQMQPLWADSRNGYLKGLIEELVVLNHIKDRDVSSLFYGKPE